MKTLTQYTTDGMSAAMEKAGAFFAFSNEQFLSRHKEGTKYVSPANGLLCPTETAEVFVKEMDDNFKNGVAQDLAENGKDGIIKRELANHEAYYTGEIEDTVDALEVYGITKEEVRAVFLIERENVEVW